MFAVSAGTAVRYLEVPAERVPAFLAAVDRGDLDGDLRSIATTPTGATLDLPGRVRRLAAFDRLVRGAVAHAERDPVTGRLMDTGRRPRKRDRDDPSRHDGSAPEHSAPGDAAQAGSAAGAAASPAVASVIARTGRWSPATAAVAAVVAVVVAAAVIFVVARSGSGGTDGAASAAPPSAPVSIAATAPGATTAAGSAGGTTAASAGAASAAGSPSARSTTTKASASPSTGSASGSGASATARPVEPGANNPFTGRYAFTRTVTENSGNENFPIGTKDSGTLELTATCDAATCPVTLGGGGGVAKRAGDTLAFAGNSPEACPDDAGITVTDSWTVNLKPSGESVVGGVRRVTAMTGTGSVTVSEPNGCPSEIKPITYAYTAKRVG